LFLQQQRSYNIYLKSHSDNANRTTFWKTNSNLTGLKTFVEEWNGHDAFVHPLKFDTASITMETCSGIKISV